jgi:murein DD-endopeptidase MepM/ murein hydrolase activator NlpD
VSTEHPGRDGVAVSRRQPRHKQRRTPVPKQPDSQSGRVYRGRRRLPKLPSRRYAVVVTTAIIAASIVALGAAALLPDNLGNGHRDNTMLSVSDLYDQADQANRSEDRGQSIIVNGDAPDVWRLPVDPKLDASGKITGYVITSRFVARSLFGRARHFGIDFACQWGTPVHAAQGGVVTFAGASGGYGYMVEIDHGNGIRTRYGHLSSWKVTVGQKVDTWQVIALSGNTGDSTGPHVHYEVRINNNPIDPDEFMLEHGVDIDKGTEEANGAIVVG